MAQDQQLYAAMLKLGVKWPKDRAIPTYPASMSDETKKKADDLYDRMSQEFLDSFGVSGNEAAERIVNRLLTEKRQWIVAKGKHTPNHPAYVQDDGSWGPYKSAAVFGSEEEAEKAGKKASPEFSDYAVYSFGKED